MSDKNSSKLAPSEDLHSGKKGRPTNKKELIEAIETPPGPQQVVSNETLFSKKFDTISDAPYLTMQLKDIPPHLDLPLDEESKNRFYPDGYALYNFSYIELFELKDKTKGKKLGQLFFHKEDIEGPIYYYIYEVYVGRNDPRSLYDGRILYLLTPHQFDEMVLVK